MSGARRRAGKRQGFFAGRIVPFEPLTETETAALAASMDLSVVELSQRGLRDGRSAIRAFEMLIDADLCIRLARENLPTAREIAWELAKIADELGRFQEFLAQLVPGVSEGSPISTAAAAARMRLLPNRPYELARHAASISMAAIADAMALDAEARTEGRQRSSEEDVAFGALADILLEIGLGLDVRQDSELANGGGVFYDACLVLSAIVLARLTRASSIEKIPGAGVAADRLRRFLALKPATIARRLRQARVGSSEQTEAEATH